MTDKEKLLLIMKYFETNDYYRFNELKVAEHNLLHHPRSEPEPLLLLYRQICFREMYDKIWKDVSRILYDWQF